MAGIPTNVEDPYVLVEGGGYHTCALTDQNEPICWGARDSGQATPPPFIGFRRLTTGGSFSCGIQPDTLMTCFGANREGQLDAPPGAYEQVSAGFNHACALTTGGEVVCWGDNSYNQSLPPADGIF